MDERTKKICDHLGLTVKAGEAIHIEEIDTPYEDQRVWKVCVECEGCCTEVPAKFTLEAAPYGEVIEDFPRVLRRFKALVDIIESGRPDPRPEQLRDADRRLLSDYGVLDAPDRVLDPRAAIRGVLRAKAEIALRRNRERRATVQFLDDPETGEMAALGVEDKRTKLVAAEEPQEEGP